MSHELMRLTNSLFSQPLLMTQASCEDVLQYLDKRNSASLKDLTDIASANVGSLFESSSEVDNIEGVGVINITGSISTYKTGFESLCPITSLESMIEQAVSFSKDESIHTILLNVKSGGGQAHKAFEQARRLKEVVEGSGKKLVAYIDQLAASCAYVIACVASEVIINPSAESGSIGVLIELMNNTEALKKEGYSRKFITSSDGKIPFNEEGDFREEFLEGLQDTVLELYGDFVSHVATFRGMDEKVIKDTNAGVFSSEKSLELGLVDKIMETKEFYDYLTSLTTKQNNKPKETLMSDQPVTPELSAEDIAAMQTQLAQMEDMQAQLSAFKAKEVEAEKASLTSNLESKSFLADCKENLVDFFMNANVDADIKSLMNTVIDSATVEMGTLSETHTAELAKASKEAEEKLSSVEAELATAKAEAADTKEEFGLQEQLSDEHVPNAEKVSMADQLKSNIAKVKASQS